MSAQRHFETVSEAFERDLIELVRDEIARRARGELWAEFQEYDEAHSDPQEGNACPHEWAKHLEFSEHPIWVDAMAEARERNTL